MLYRGNLDYFSDNVALLCKARHSQHFWLRALNMSRHLIWATMLFSCHAMWKLRKVTNSRYKQWNVKRVIRAAKCFFLCFRGGGGGGGGGGESLFMNGNCLDERRGGGGGGQESLFMNGNCLDERTLSSSTDIFYLESCLQEKVANSSLERRRKKLCANFYFAQICATF